MYLENFSGSASRTGDCGSASRTGNCGASETGGTGGRAGAGGTGESVETYFLKLYLIDCEIVERLHIK